MSLHIESNISFEIESSQQSSSKSSKRKLVPIHETSKRKKLNDGMTKMKDILNEIKVVKNDPTKELITLMREDNEKQAKKDEIFMLMSESLHQPVPHPLYFSQVNQAPPSQPSSSGFQPQRQYYNYYQEQ